MPSLALGLRVEQSGEQLLVTYELTNSANGEPLFLLNQLTVARKFTTEAAYVCWVANATAVMLQGPGPEGGDPLQKFYGADFPGGTLLPPGGRFSTTIAAPIPLEEWSGHQPVSAATPVELVSVDRVMLRLAYLRDSAKFYSEEHSNFPGVFRVNGYPVEWFEASAELSTPCALNRRKDNFVRF